MLMNIYGEMEHGGDFGWFGLFPINLPIWSCKNERNIQLTNGLDSRKFSLYTLFTDIMFTSS